METSNLPASIGNMAAAIVAAADTTTVGSGDLFMKFSKGSWSFGAEGTEPEEGSTWAVNPASLSRGFQAWGETDTPQDGQLLGERIMPIGQEPVVGELPDVAGKWQAAASLQMKCLDGEDKGIQVIFKTCSGGGVRAFNEHILLPISNKLRAGDAKCVPIVKLETSGYTHKKKSIGWVATPVFSIVGWTDGDDAGDTAEKVDVKPSEEPAPEQEEAPRRRRRKAS